MPAFLLTLPDNARFTLPDAASAMVVFAADAADARAVAQAEYSGDSNAAWTAATALEVAVGALADLTLRVRVLDAPTLIDISVNNLTRIGVDTPVVDTAGTSYVAGDILTVVGAATRAATIRVLTAGGGTIDTVEMVDVGDYASAPSLVANAVTGGTGSGALIDLSTVIGEYKNFLAQAVTALNLDAQITDAAIDLGEGGVGSTDLEFLIASGGGGDDLGDKKIEVDFLFKGTPIPSLVGALTSEGVSTDELLAIVLGAGVPVFPDFHGVLKTV